LNLRQHNPPVQSLLNIEKILDQYNGFTIDIWGVVHDGFKPYPGVVQCLNHMIALDKQIIFLSNAPRPGMVVAQKLLEFGINITSGMILTSGDIVRYQLQHFDDQVFKKLRKQFYHLGETRNQDILANLTVDTVDNIADADFILLTAFTEEGEDLSQFDADFKIAIEHKLPLICANPDKKIIHGHTYRYCSGIFAERYEEMGGKVHYYGKPYPAVYEVAFKQLALKGVNDKKKILMIGDTLETDIKGANKMGIDSALVLTGNMELHLQNKSDKLLTTLQKLEHIFAYYALSPTWVLQEFSL
jgi:HAD superfamily hydrolase (TIGR01459 family)